MFEGDFEREGFVKIWIERVFLDGSFFLLEPFFIEHDSYLDIRVGQSADVHFLQILSGVN